MRKLCCKAKTELPGTEVNERGHPGTRTTSDTEQTHEPGDPAISLAHNPVDHGAGLDKVSLRFDTRDVDDWITGLILSMKDLVYDFEGADFAYVFPSA